MLIMQQVGLNIKTQLRIDHFFKGFICPKDKVGSTNVAVEILNSALDTSSNTNPLSKFNIVI